MDSEAFNNRTKAYALRVIRLVDSLPKDEVSRTLGHPLLRSGCSVSANYRAASRARSRADFIAKLGIVEEECDETIHWIELLTDSGRIAAGKVASLKQDGVEMLSMVVASIKTAKLRRQNTQ